MPRADGPAEVSWEGLTDEERDVSRDRQLLDWLAERGREAGWTRRCQVDERTARTTDPEPAHEGQMTLEEVR